MKKHLSIFLKILGKGAVYITVPALFYGVLLLIWSIVLRREIQDQMTGFLIDLFTLLSVITVFKLYKKRTLKKLFATAISFRKILQLIPISLLARLPLVIFAVLLIVLFGDVITQTFDQGIEYQWEGFDDSNTMNHVLSLFSFAIIGPIHEELFFRGIIYNFLKKSYSIRVSIVYSSIFFAVFHFHPGLYLSSLILGFFLVYVYEKWNNLLYAILLHILINLHPFIIEALSR